MTLKRLQILGSIMWFLIPNPNARARASVRACACNGCATKAAVVAIIVAHEHTAPAHSSSRL